MKTYKEMTASLLRRRDQYLKRKKAARRKLFTASMCAITLTAVGSIVGVRLSSKNNASPGLVSETSDKRINITTEQSITDESGNVSFSDIGPEASLSYMSYEVLRIEEVTDETYTNKVLDPMLENTVFYKVRSSLLFSFDKDRDLLSAFGENTKEGDTVYFYVEADNAADLKANDVILIKLRTIQRRANGERVNIYYGFFQENKTVYMKFNNDRLSFENIETEDYRALLNAGTKMDIENNMYDGMSLEEFKEFYRRLRDYNDAVWKRIDQLSMKGIYI